MRVGIIGVGNIGGALAGSLAKAGHEVVVAASAAEHAREAARRVDCEPAASVVEAAEQADAVILAVPSDALGAVADEIREAVGGKPVIDVSNGPHALESGRSLAESLQQQLPDAHVVKAFNTVFGANLRGANGDERRLDGFMAGDDPEAKATAARLVEGAGLEPVDVGELKLARVLEGMAWVNIHLNMSQGWSWTSAWQLSR